MDEENEKIPGGDVEPMIGSFVVLATDMDEYN